MTKQTITETLGGDWILALDGLTVTEAIEWFTTLPAEAIFYQNWTGYEEVQGDILLNRDETDEEYSYRLQCEKEARIAAEKKASNKRLDDQKNIDMAIKRLKEQMKELQKVRPK